MGWLGACGGPPANAAMKLTLLACLRARARVPACAWAQPFGRDALRADSRCVQGHCAHASHDRGQLQKGTEEAARPRPALKGVLGAKGCAVPAGAVPAGACRVA